MDNVPAENLPPKEPDALRAFRPEECPVPHVSRTREVVDNLPYLAMIVLGAAIFWRGADHGPWRWLLTALYVVYGVGGAFWIMLFICPFCHFHGTRLCPCGYGQIAAKLRPAQDGSHFPAQFKKHIPVIVPLWFLPLIAGGVGLWSHMSWLMIGLLVAFAVDSFLILPLVSRMYGCAECPQKATCPWMGGCKRARQSSPPTTAEEQSSMERYTS